MGRGLRHAVSTDETAIDGDVRGRGVRIGDGGGGLAKTHPTGEGRRESFEGTRRRSATTTFTMTYASGWRDRNRCSWRKSF